jgi:DNA-binding response OmpR family regulator
MRTVLIIEDAPHIANELCARLKAERFPVRVAATAEAAALALVEIERPCVVLIDPFMPALRTWDLVASLDADDVLATIPVRLSGGVRLLKETYALESIVSVIRDHCHPSPAHAA